jgi:hypothetical protein
VAAPPGLKTMSRNLLNLGLFVTVALLAAVVIWEPGQQQGVTGKPLSSLQADDIQRIHVQRDGLQDVQLQKQEGNWQMLAPYRVDADNTRVRALLRLADATSHASFSAGDRRLADFGLAPARAQVRFDDSLFQFGGLEHISKRRYVLLDGTIHLITDLFYHQLRTSATQFVSPRLFSPTQRITRLLLADRQYAQQHDGSWLVTPAADSVSADQLNEFIEHWQRLRASRVSSADEQGGKEQVSIELADGSKLVFEIVRSENEVVFTRRDLGLQYHVPVETAEALFALPKPNAPEQN